MATARGLYTHGKSDDGLTARQRQVLSLLREGKSQTEVSTALEISRQRVRQIVESLLAKGVELEGVKPPEPGSWLRKQAAKSAEMTEEDGRRVGGDS